MYQPDIIPLCLYPGNHVDYPVPLSENYYKCNPTNLVKEFYVINGDFRPVPQGMIMYCASGIGSSTISVSIVSDIYNTEYPKSCIRFIAWGKPVPNTIPLVIGEKTIYVLPNSTNKFIIKDNKCIPDILGKPLDQCMVDNIQQSNGKKQSLLSYLESGIDKNNGNNYIMTWSFILILLIILIIWLTKKP